MARQDARLQGEHARGSEQPRRSPQRDARSLTPRLSPTFHSSCPKSGDGASTQPLCSPSTSVLIPSETTPRTSDPSHDPSSTLPHVPRPKEAAGSRRSPASCELSVVLGDRDCAHRRATRALVSCASSAAILPPRLSRSPGAEEEEAHRGEKCTLGLPPRHSRRTKLSYICILLDCMHICILCHLGIAVVQISTHTQRSSSHILDRVPSKFTQRMCSQVCDGNQHPRADDRRLQSRVGVEYSDRKVARRGMESIEAKWQIWTNVGYSGAAKVVQQRVECIGGRRQIWTKGGIPRFQNFCTKKMIM